MEAKCKDQERKQRTMTASEDLKAQKDDSNNEIEGLQ